VSIPARSTTLGKGGFAVKKSQYTEEQIAYASKQAEHGTLKGHVQQ